MSRLPNKIYTNDLKPVEVEYRNTVSPEEFLRNNFGGALSHVPELDGKIHRFRPEGSRDEDGWYVFFESDGYIFGSAGDSPVSFASISSNSCLFRVGRTRLLQ